MAIQRSYTSRQGVVANEAYHRIMSVDYRAEGWGEKYGSSGTNTKMTIYVYTDANSRQNGFDALDIMSITFTMNVSNTGANPVTQAYEALKTKTAVVDQTGGWKDIDYTSNTIDV